MEVGESMVSPKQENKLPTESPGPFSAPVMGMVISVSGEMSVGQIDISRKKRGRPRKYGPEGSMALALTPSFSSASPTDFSGKRRGRPPGSGKRQMLAALGDWVASSAGGSFIPHVITVAAGEDVARRILAFSQQGPRSICILSANGSVSNVTLRQPGSSGGTLTYEGRFEILSLSGSFTLTENDGVLSRTGGISVSLAGPDGRVVGGGVAGLLLAASPIQVVVGSFMPNLKTPRKKPNPEPHVFSGIPTTLPTVTEARPISQAPPEEDEEDTCRTPSSKLPGRNHGEGDNGGSCNEDTRAASYQTVGWQVSRATSEHKISPDINVRPPGE